MYTLGIGDVTHDKSVCLMKDNKILAAIEEERLTRIKHGLKLDASKYNILEQGEYVYRTINKLNVSEREQMYSSCVDYCIESNGININDIDCIVVSSLYPDLPFRHKSVALHHHVAHCASSFYPSPFKKAAILVIDGYGVHTNGYSESVMCALGAENKLSVLDIIEGCCDFTEKERKQVPIKLRGKNNCCLTVKKPHN